MIVRPPMSRWTVTLFPYTTQFRSLALVDLRSGKIASKGFARAAMQGVDMTPTAFFLDSPAWAPDPSVQGYVRTCQGTRAGDPINPVYYDRSEEHTSDLPSLMRISYAVVCLKQTTYLTSISNR